MATASSTPDHSGHRPFGSARFAGSGITGWKACLLLVAVATVGRAAAAWHLAAPWIAPDEPTYGLLGRSLWHTGRLTILGQQGPFYGIVYPAFAGLPLSLFGVLRGVQVLQIVQALAMSAAGPLVYAWARRIMSPGRALLAAALALALPAFAYTGLLMTEAVYYPAATLALFAIARALESPSLDRQALALAAILVASLTRLQGLALLPVLVTAVLTLATFERSLRLLRRFAVVLGVLAAAAAMLAVAHFAGSAGDFLGAYTTTARASYQAGAAARWIVWHTGDLFLLVAGLPLLATLVLVVSAARGREGSPAARALLAVSVSYAVCTVAQVGLFASRFSGVLLERNLITLAPPLFIAFALWLERGLPRPQPATALVCVLAVVPALLLPVRRLTDPAAQPEDFTALPLGHLRAWTSAGAAEAAWVAGVIVVAALFLVVPRRAAGVLPAIAIAMLVGASWVAATDVRQLAAGLQRQLFGGSDTRWVDHSARGPVAYVDGGSPFWNGSWLYPFWNQRIALVVALPGPRPGPLPPHLDVSPRFDGRLFTTTAGEIDEPYVLAPNRFTFVGARVRSVIQATDDGALTLWQVDPPLRLQTVGSGFQPNGDILGHAQLDVYGCAAGRLELTLLGKQGTPVRLTVDGLELKTVTPAPGTVAHVSLPAPPDANGNTRCSFGIDSPGLLGSTRVEFVPAAG